MPELPEAEVVAREVRASILQATIKDCWIGRPDIVREGLDTLDWYRGSRVVMVERRGKSVAVTLERAGERRYLVAELGMTGLLLFKAPDDSYHKHTHLILTLETPLPSVQARRGSATARIMVSELRYWNPRRFGRVYLMDAGGLARFCSRRFGCDPLTISAEEFSRVIKARRGRIKALLLHQQRIAGIGNIYANEILHRAGIHPHGHGAKLSRVAIGRLYHAMRAVLQEAIAGGGSSIRDFLSPSGRPGRFQEWHRVYNKAGLPCPTCGAPIKRLVTERSSFYCPRCQRRAR